MDLISSEKLAELKELSNGNMDLIKVLLEKYLTNSNEFVKQIRESLKKDDREKIKFAIHTLKGSSLSLGLVPLGEIFTVLNQKVKDNDFEGMELKMDEIEVHLKNVNDYFKSLS